MGKKYGHWNDKLYEENDYHLDSGFLANRLVQQLTDWVIHDFTIQTGMTQYQIDLQRRRCQKLLDIAEQIECLCKHANSIYMVYPEDFEERRSKWLQAKGCCFQLTAMLAHVIHYVEKDTNVDKYLQIQPTVNKIVSKIKTSMIADDNLRKKNNI